MRLRFGTAHYNRGRVLRLSAPVRDARGQTADSRRWALRHRGRSPIALVA